MKRWVWLLESVVLAIHDQQLAEHGGGAGVRDRGLLSSALARAHQLAVYGDADVADCAAAYGYGIARNHPFLDGNKRTAYVAMELFLLLNGYGLEVSDAQAVTTLLDVAAGQITEKQFGRWIREHAKAVRRP